MRYYFMLLFCCAGLFSGFSQADLIRAKADTLLKETVRRGEFVGVTAGIYHRGEVLWTNGSGFADRDNRTRATPDMINRLASITKPMTAIAILKLANAGRVDLDVPVQTYLPQFPRKPEGAITLRHLLTHTSGMAAYRSRHEFVSDVHYPNQAAAMTFFQDRDLLFAPGEGFQYTTYGYVVLGAVIEAVTGRSYAEHMREAVWVPARMDGIDIERHHDVPGKAKLYGRKGPGEFTSDPADDLSIKYAGGGTHATVNDVLAFGAAILEGTLINETDLARMREIPDVPRQGTPYGMGWYVVDHPEHGRIVRHGGAQSGTSTYLEIYLDRELVVAVLANTSQANGVYPLKDRLAALVLDEAARRHPVPTLVELSSEELKRFETSFQLKDYQIKILEKDGRLISRVKGNPDLELFPGGSDRLHYAMFDQTLHFSWDKKGRVSGVVVENPQGKRQGRVLK